MVAAHPLERGSFSSNTEADYEVRHAEVRTWRQSGEQTENEIILCSGYISFQVSLELSEPAAVNKSGKTVALPERGRAIDCPSQ